MTLYPKTEYFVARNGNFVSGNRQFCCRKRQQSRLFPGTNLPFLTMKSPETATKYPASGYKVAVFGNKIACSGYNDSSVYTGGTCFGNQGGQALMQPRLKPLTHTQETCARNQYPNRTHLYLVTVEDKIFISHCDSVQDSGIKHRRPIKPHKCGHVYWCQFLI